MKLKDLTANALLTGLALIIFVIELQLPALSPVPGLKLGLSNIITVYAVFLRTPLDAFMILTARILLGTFLSGNLSALMYSAAGGALCLVAMIIFRRMFAPRRIWAASVFGAIFHNLGQVLVAVAVTRTPALMAYLPILTAGGMVAGLFTGLCAQFLIMRMLGRG